MSDKSSISWSMSTVPNAFQDDCNDQYNSSWHKCVIINNKIWQAYANVLCAYNINSSKVNNTSFVRAGIQQNAILLCSHIALLLMFRHHTRSFRLYTATKKIKCNNNYYILSYSQKLDYKCQCRKTLYHQLWHRCLIREHKSMRRKAYNVLVG